MYRMILPETRADVDAVASDSAASTRPAEADAAAKRTRADYGRVSRWALGLVGTAGAAFAVLIAAGAVALWTDGSGAGAVVLGGVILFVAVTLGVPAVWLLVALHRSGRRLARAAGFWAGLPYRQGVRQPTRGDWFAVRFLGFRSDLFLRLITSALAALATVFSASLFVRALVDGLPMWQAVLWAGWAVLFAAVTVGQFGGVQRIQNGHLSRDPAPLVRR